jgi:hypothetical protein
MKAWIVVLVLVLLDGALYWGIERLERERAGLESRREALAQRAEEERRIVERSHEVKALLESTERSMGSASGEALDIARLRELLLSAERGLDIDRFSLDFRPSQELAEGREGGRIHASLGGSFDAIYDYLRRVEEMRLPLAPDTVSLRANELGRILLEVDWNGLWREDGTAMETLTPSEIARLEGWLGREPVPPPGRDPFTARALSPEEKPSTSPVIPFQEPVAPLSSASAEPAPLVSETPKLTGFVIARPELETDVSRRVLAALRFEGSLRLLGVGDAIGGYRVEEIEARDSVVLVNQESGERLTLFLP